MRRQLSAVVAFALCAHAAGRPFPFGRKLPRAATSGRGAASSGPGGRVALGSSRRTPRSSTPIPRRLPPRPPPRSAPVASPRSSCRAPRLAILGWVRRALAVRGAVAESRLLQVLQQPADADLSSLALEGPPGVGESRARTTSPTCAGPRARALRWCHAGAGARAQLGRPASGRAPSWRLEVEEAPREAPRQDRGARTRPGARARCAPRCSHLAVRSTPLLPAWHGSVSGGAAPPASAQWREGLVARAPRARRSLSL